MPVGLPPVDYGSGSSNAFGSILGAVPVVGGILNGVSQIFTNARNRRFQKEMYGIQRKDSLADWNMQNEYNSPAAQMARLKAAGLNPNLVYGSGAVATTTQMPRASSSQSGNAQAPQLETSGVIQSLMYGLKSEMQAQQIENLKTQNLVLQSQAQKNALSSDTMAFDLAFKAAMRETDIGIREEMLKRLGLGNELTSSAVGLNLQKFDYNQLAMPKQLDALDISNANNQQLNVLRSAANARAESQNLADLKIKAQQVINMMQQNTKTFNEVINLQEAAKGIRRANTLAELDIYLKSAGFNWNDPVILRQLRMSPRGYQK